MDGMLHLDDVCLYRSPCASLVESSTLKCIGSIVRKSIVSNVDENGLCNFCPSSISTLDAICVLVHRGHTVCVVQTMEGRGVYYTGNEYHIPIHQKWSIASLLDTGEVNMVDCNQDINPCLFFTDGYTITLTHDEINIPLTVRETLFHSVVSSSTYRLRISHDAHSTPCVARYSNGILVAVDILTPCVPCGTILIDERGEFDTYTSTIRSDVLLPVASVLLRADMVPIIASSPLLGHLMETISCRWYSHLKCLWTMGTCETLLGLLRNPSTPDSIARSIDPYVLIDKRFRNERLNVLGATITRRLECCDATRYADMRASTVIQHGIARFDALPIARSRFDHLYKLGIFSGMAACRTAVVIELDTVCLMLLPADVKQTNLTEAVLSLLVGSDSMSGDNPIVCFSFGVYYMESSSQCPDTETLISFRLDIDTASRTLRLLDDTDEKFEIVNVISVDELERMTIPCDASRTRRSDVALLFPEMSKRIDAGSSIETSACLQEVQRRRVTNEWMLDGIDAGHNMSSMGLVIIMYLLLSKWLGAKCRIAQSRCGAALIAVHTGTEYCLVDPCRTLFNFFTLTREISLQNQGTSPVQGMVVEVRQNKQFKIGVVRIVDVVRGTMIVQLGTSESRVAVSIGTHAWRRVGRDTSDTDRVVRPLLLRTKRSRDE